MLVNFKTLSKIALVLLTVSGCGAHIPIKDHTVWGDKGIFGSTEVHTLFTNIPAKNIDKQTWDMMRVGMVCTSVASFAGIQKTVDQLCAQNKTNCNYEQQQARASFKIAVYRILAASKKAGIKVDPKIDAVFTPSFDDLAVSYRGEF